MALVSIEIRYPDGRTEQRDLVPGTYRIGREVADITLSDPSVSTRHAELVFEPGRLALRDLGSTNGSFGPDGTRISDVFLLAPGEPVRLGACALVWKPRTQRGGTGVMPAAGGTHVLPQMPEPPAAVTAPSAATVPPAAAATPPAPSPGSAAVAPSASVPAAKKGKRGRWVLTVLVVAVPLCLLSWCGSRAVSFVAGLTAQCPAGTWDMVADNQLQRNIRRNTDGDGEAIEHESFRCTIQGGDSGTWTCAAPPEGAKIDAAAFQVWVTTTLTLKGRYSYRYSMKGQNSLRIEAVDVSNLQAETGGKVLGLIDIKENTTDNDPLGQAMLRGLSSAGEFNAAIWKSRYTSLQGREVQFACDGDFMRTNLVNRDGSLASLATYRRAD